MSARQARRAGRGRPARRGAARGALALGVALAVGALGAGCLDVARQRAEDDLHVGQVRTAEAEHRVEGGLAAVRAVGEGTLHLRAQAPAFRVQSVLRGGRPTLTLTVNNLLPDAVLTAESLGAALAVLERSPPGAREKTWEVTLPVGAGPHALTLAVAPPDQERRGPFRFALLADVQEAIDEVGDIYRVINADPRVRFVLFSGDLTRQGTRAEIAEFEARERELIPPLYATLGNHELGADQLWFQRYYGRCSTSFTHRGVRFTLLDSASATIEPLALGWLDGWLAAGRGGVHVVAMHIPPLDPVGTRGGAFASRAEAARLLRRLAEGGVDLTLYGHLHSHYAFENAGIPAYISGGGGAIEERFDGIRRHYLAVDVDPDRGVQGVAIQRVD